MSDNTLICDAFIEFHTVHKAAWQQYFIANNSKMGLWFQSYIIKRQHNGHFALHLSDSISSCKCRPRKIVDIKTSIQP